MSIYVRVSCSEILCEFQTFKRITRVLFSTTYKTCSPAKTLQVSFVGMQTQEVAIKPNLRVILKTDAHVLDEVMVVAYGTAKKSSFTGSAAVVDSKKIEKRDS